MYPQQKYLNENQVTTFKVNFFQVSIDCILCERNYCHENHVLDIFKEA